MFKNPRDKTKIVHLAWRVYPDYISSFHKTYLEDFKDPHSYIFLNRKQSSKHLLIFRTRIFPGKIVRCLHLFNILNRIKSKLNFRHVLQYTKPEERRALFASADYKLIKAIVECGINTLNGNNKLTKD